MHFLRGYMDGVHYSWSVNRGNLQCSNTPSNLTFIHFIFLWKSKEQSYFLAHLFTRIFAMKRRTTFSGRLFGLLQKNDGTFLPGRNQTVRNINGYDWKVIVDPTRSGDDLGVFYDGLFHKTSLGSRFETITPIPHCLFSFLDRTAILCTGRT